MKASDLPGYDEVLAEQLDDPEFRQEWDRTAFARLVANHVVSYRAEHGLSQAELGNRLGMAQPAVARLESGDREPSLATLARLARRLGIEFHIDITPTSLRVTA
ncbi:MAG TPA: helix-turn-helix transcriptional regulator [Actinomycetes bacterium]